MAPVALASMPAQRQLGQSHAHAAVAFSLELLIHVAVEDGFLVESGHRNCANAGWSA